MVNNCVYCGDVIPNEEKVCPHCFDHGILCPNCGNTLEVMHSSECIIDNKLVLCTLYHCRNCHLDWEREASYIGEPVKFTRKYWG